VSVYSCSAGACGAPWDNGHGMPGCVCLCSDKGNDALVYRSGGPAQRLGFVIVCGVSDLDACGRCVLFVYSVDGLVGSIQHPLNQLFYCFENARRHVSAPRLPALDAVNSNIEKNSGLSVAETADFQKVVEVVHKYIVIPINPSGAKPPITKSIISSLDIVAFSNKFQIPLVFCITDNATNARNKFAVHDCRCHTVICPATFRCADVFEKHFTVADVATLANGMGFVMVNHMLGAVAKLVYEVVRVSCIALHDLVNDFGRKIFAVKLKLIFVCDCSHNRTLSGYSVDQFNRLVIVLYIQKTKHQAQNYGAPYVCSSGALGARKSAPTELWHYSIRRRRAPMRLRRIWGAAANMPDTKLVPCGLVKDDIELRHEV